MGLRLALLVAAALMASCRDDVVELQIGIPADVSYDRIRIVKSVAGKPDDELNTRTMPKGIDAGLGIRFAGIYFPRDVEEVRVVVQAILESQVVAQKQGTIYRGGSKASLLLEVCIPAVPIEKAETCAVPLRPVELPDGGPEPDVRLVEPEGGVVADVSDTAPDNAVDGDRADRVPAMCTNPMDDETWRQEPPPSMLSDSPECVQYCKLMLQNCSDAFGSEARCLFACRELSWRIRDPSQAPNTIECRIGWAMLAGESGLGELVRMRRCGNAEPNSFPGCGDPCDIYCHAGSRICGVDERKCKAACQAKVQAWQDPTQQTLYNMGVRCRLDWLHKAVFDQRLCSLAVPEAPQLCGRCEYLGFTGY
jgi:hypothetical protein